MNTIVNILTDELADTIAKAMTVNHDLLNETIERLRNNQSYLMFCKAQYCNKCAFTFERNACINAALKHYGIQCGVDNYTVLLKALYRLYDGYQNTLPYLLED